MCPGFYPHSESSQHMAHLYSVVFSFGEKKYFFSGDLGINFHVIVFREILCLLHFVLTSLNGR